jgi:hypothetical protein
MLSEEEFEVQTRNRVPHVADVDNTGFKNDWAFSEAGNMCGGLSEALSPIAQHCAW